MKKMIIRYNRLIKISFAFFTILTVLSACVENKSDKLINKTMTINEKKRELYDLARKYNISEERIQIIDDSLFLETPISFYEGILKETVEIDAQIIEGNESSKERYEMLMDRLEKSTDEERLQILKEFSDVVVEIGDTTQLH